MRVTRQKGLLRATTELCLVEAIRQEKGKAKAASSTESSAVTSTYLGAEWLYTVFREMLANDREHTNIPIVFKLLKGLGTTLIGQSPNADISAGLTNKMAELNVQSTEEDRLLPLEMQMRFRSLCETYYNTLARRVAKEYARLQEQDRRNHEAYIKSGEIFEDRQQNYEKMTKNYEKLESWCKTFSELIELPMPALANENRSTGVGLAINMDPRSSLNANDKWEAEYASGKSPWEDDDTRRFYESVVDLAEMVPMALLSIGQVKAKGVEDKVTASPDTAGKDIDDTEVVASPQPDQADLDKVDDVGKEDIDEKITIGAGPAAQLNALTARLPEMYNRTMVDSTAVDFAFLNSKMARKKLIKHLAAIPRNRTDLIPHYARLIATLNRYMPDIGQGIMAVLDDEFRYLQKKRNVDMAETRAKNMRFIGELTKFNVAPLYTTFHCFKVCLDDFSGPNIDNLATILETCGRYLLRTAETSERMAGTLEMLKRKRAAQNLDHRQLVLLDNAYYQCNPPEREVAQQKQYTPMQMYINHLIYDVLTKKTLDYVVNMLRKLPWEDEAVLDTLHNVFLRAWRIRFGNLHLLAVMLHELQIYHPDFVVFIIDGVCENIRSGMESNIFKDNQRRVSTVKYLAELYNYRMVNSSIVFDQLWSLVMFGHPGGRPLPGQISPIDAPDDYFRIRLVCTMLDACGHCFDRGILKKRLDDFLLFLNIYILSKTQPLPMDVNFMLSDTLETLRPQFQLKKTFEEAAVAVDEMISRQSVKAADADMINVVDQSKEALEDGDQMDSDSSDEDDEDTLEGLGKRPRKPQSISTSESEAGDEEAAEGSTDGEGTDGEEDEVEEDEGLLPREAEESLVDREAEDEFERELAKMMAESNPTPGSNANRTQRGLFDVGLPFIKKNVNDNQVEIIPSDDQHMRFSLLSKRGNKHLTHQVQVPIDSAIAVNSLANEKQQLAERQQLKQLVLGIETREQIEDRRCEFSTFRVVGKESC